MGSPASYVARGLASRDKPAPYGLCSLRVRDPAPEVGTSKEDCPGEMNLECDAPERQRHRSVDVFASRVPKPGRGRQRQQLRVGTKLTVALACLVGILSALSLPVVQGRGLSNCRFRSSDSLVLMSRGN